MAKLPMYQNMLACYPAILERMKQVPGVSDVLEAADLEAVTSDRKIKPQDGAVYVVFDGFTPDAAAGNKGLLRERLSFSFILAKRQYNPNRLQYGADGVGETITAIKSAFQGFDPCGDNGQKLTLEPFTARAALPIAYHEGFAFFPMRFETAVAIELRKD
ncbi:MULTISPECIES: hypothetical protein [unclassified Neisseria]|uniref:phage tail terminator protein n=1 Tax=unclassified Neisseria TaxID=2623750 RepID=UPI0010727F15|nr:MULTISPECIES: hypothetical protein [unclassified Neisseria]MBF0803358.1 hypothetical protein [Neisseria sp. 19428wB4_WF04]TFU44022.1 hypothetical protein E4T99_03155 [Neisseria sp. WF04]